MLRGADAPHNLIEWDATSLTTSWAGYRVYRRKSGAQAASWTKIGDITEVASVGSDMSTTDAEAQRTQFKDYEAALSPTEYDYYVSVVRDDGAESIIEGIEPRNSITQHSQKYWWFTSNKYPDSNLALENMEAPGIEYAETVQTWDPAGRDTYITARRTKRPGRLLTLRARRWGTDGGTIMPGSFNNWEDVRAVLQSSTQPARYALVDPHGNVVYGTPDLRSVKMSNDAGNNLLSVAEFDFWETSLKPNTAVGWQGPARLVLDRSLSQYVDYGDVSSCNFQAGQGFTALCYCAIYPAQTGNYGGLIAKSDGATDGWILYVPNSGTGVRVWIRDGTTAAGVTSTTTGLHDGIPRVYGLRRDPVDDDLGVWIDGSEDNTVGDTTTGGFENAADLRAGSYGTSHLSGDIIAWAVWGRALTDAEMGQAAYAMRRYPGWVLPPFAQHYSDLRDSRCYTGSGTVSDLSGNGAEGTVTGNPIWVPKEDA